MQRLTCGSGCLNQDIEISSIAKIKNIFQNKKYERAKPSEVNHE